MQKQSIRTALAIGLIAGTGALAFAQEGNTTFYTGEHIVAGGEAPIFSSFTPSANDATSRMYNDGATNGDTSSTDHIWTYVGTNATPGAAGTFAKWKYGTWDGVNASTDWAHQSSNNHVYPADAASVNFHWVDPNGSTGDGWLPNNDYLYTVPSATAARLQAAASMSVWGSFTTELGGPGDWNGSANHLPLVRNATTETWEVTLSGWQSIGNKQFKVVMDGDWGDTREIGARGLGGGDNIAMFILNKADVVTVKVRESDARYQIDGLTPLPTTDGLYALGPWTVTPETDSVMTPVTDGFEGTFTVPTAGTHTVTLFQITGGSLGTLYPAQGGHPFKTTTASQQVRVNLHTASMADGAFPDTNFIYTDPASRLDFTATANGRLQWVGMLGMWGTRYDAGGGDWLVPSTDLVGTNDPVGTQVGADAFLYRWDAPTTNHGTAAPGLNKPFKAVGRTDDVPSSATNGYDLQLGGGNPTGNEYKSGLTLLGDNPNPTMDFLDATDYSFFVDTATGRTKVQLAADPVPTLRPARANDAVGSTSVQDWTVY